MSRKLVERADTLRTRFRTLEGVPGSGHHDADRNVANPNLFAAPQRNGLPRCSEHVVFFTDRFDEWVTFAGDDAAKVLEALLAWKKKTDKLDPSTLTGTERKLVTRVIPSIAANNTDKEGKLLPGEDGVCILEVRRDYWNDVLFALQSEGLGVSGLPLEE